MTTLRAPGLGPIVGHTTDRTARLWMQAPSAEAHKRAAEEDRRTIGVLVVVARGGEALPVGERPAFYFRLRREFDRTGAFTLGEERGLGERGEPWPLQPDTEYRVRLASLAVDDNYDNDARVASDLLVDRLPPPSVWAREVDDLPASECEAQFRTLPAPDAARDAFAFLMGSCRYPGLLWKVKESDRIFGPMYAETRTVRGGVTPSLVLMTGDQIYADAFHRSVPVGLADTHEEFTARYRQAFGSLNMRRLLRSAPHYMILDDHEIEDNWAADRIGRPGKKLLFNLAVGAYMSYQWSHGPRSYGRRLYYRFDGGGYPFFVLDTRTQRVMDDVADALEDNHLLGRPSLDPSEPSQLEILCDWLVEQQRRRGDAPKFIVSASVFVPNPVYTRRGARVADLEKSDSWPAFPQTRRALLRTIVEHRVQNVVFLSGDVHCAHVAQLSFAGAPAAERLRAFSVVSSAFYWPFPFADGDPADFIHDSRDPRTPDTFEVGDGVTMDYRAWNFTQDDNFCRLTVDRASHKLVVEVIGRDGKHITTKGPLRLPVDLTSRLELAPW
jgi:alkaline phosphatase D